MPWGDRTGPLGQGPRSGRGLGYCGGYGSPGYISPAPGRGMGLGRRWMRGLGWLGRLFGGRGRGRGYRWARWFTWGGATPSGLPTASSGSPPTTTLDLEQERQLLEQEAAALEETLQHVRNRIATLEKRIQHARSQGKDSLNPSH